MVREYDDDEHYEMIKSWWDARKSPHISQDMLPAYGLVVEGVACGFLITTDCNLGILEYYTSNPDAPKDVRGEALDQITNGLIEYGISVCGITNFKADTDAQPIRERAAKLGFGYVGELSTFFLKVRE